MQGFVNSFGQAAIDAAAATTQSLVDQERWCEATIAWSNTETVVERETNGVNFYNVLAEENIYDSQLTKKRKNYMSFKDKHIRKLLFSFNFSLKLRDWQHLFTFFH